MVATGQARDHTVIMAEAQSAGRGRYRRTWISHHGNLYASFIYDAEERDPRLSYMIAVAIAETLIHFGMHPKIKWPNDILIDGKKVSGTLTEYAGRFVIIGIGINIKSNPTVDKYQTDSFPASKTPLLLFKSCRSNTLHYVSLHETEYYT